MEWGGQQDAALVAFDEWFKAGAPGQVFHLYGYAGTGKTTLAIHLTQDIPGTVMFAAYTGKAASVMRKKGCNGATTLHSLMYNVKQGSRKAIIELELELGKLGENGDPKRREELQQRLVEAKKAAGRPSWEVNPYSPLKDAALLVVDEVSMVDERIGRDILSFKKPVLVLGDPAQLPPVMGTGFFNVDHPEVMLTEVHRMALDNPVLALATRVRQHQPIAIGDYGESRIVARAQLQGGETLDHDQVLVGRNATRHTANRAIRARLGYGGSWPLPGEKLVCLRNNHEAGLLNGTLWTVAECVEDEGTLCMKVRPDGEAPEFPTTEVVAYTEPFIGLDAPRWGGSGLDEFAYGYALTCHKAQGSEWKSVYVVDESSISRGDAHRWLYTAITRASERVTLVR